MKAQNPSNYRRNGANGVGVDVGGRHGSDGKGNREASIARERDGVR